MRGLLVYCMFSAVVLPLLIWDFLKKGREVKRLERDIEEREFIIRQQAKLHPSDE